MNSPNVPTGETTIPTFLESVRTAYSVENVPVNLDPSHPLADLWEKRVTVTSDTPPAPIHTAKGDMSDKFPFNFAEGLVLNTAKDFPFLGDAGLNPPKLVAALKIDVFRPAPAPRNARGVKVTVFSVPQSANHPNGVIVTRGLTFVDDSGNSVADGISAGGIPEESVVPPEAATDIVLP